LVRALSKRGATLTPGFGPPGRGFVVRCCASSCFKRTGGKLRPSGGRLAEPRDTFHSSWKPRFFDWPPRYRTSESYFLVEEFAVFEPCRPGNQSTASGAGHAMFVAPQTLDNFRGTRNVEGPASDGSQSTAPSASGAVLRSLLGSLTTLTHASTMSRVNRSNRWRTACQDRSGGRVPRPDSPGRRTALLGDLGWKRFAGSDVHTAAQQPCFEIAARSQQFRGAVEETCSHESGCVGEVGRGSATKPRRGLGPDGVICGANSTCEQHNHDDGDRAFAWTNGSDQVRIRVHPAVIPLDRGCDLR